MVEESPDTPVPPALSVAPDSSLALLRYQVTGASAERSFPPRRERAVLGMPSRGADLLLAAANDRINRSAPDKAFFALMEHVLGESNLAEDTWLTADPSDANGEGDAVDQAAAIDQALAELTGQ